MGHVLCEEGRDVKTEVKEEKNFAQCAISQFI